MTTEPRFHEPSDADPSVGKPPLHQSAGHLQDLEAAALQQAPDNVWGDEVEASHAVPRGEPPGFVACSTRLGPLSCPKNPGMKGEHRSTFGATKHGPKGKTNSSQVRLVL